VVPHDSNSFASQELGWRPLTCNSMEVDFVDSWAHGENRCGATAWGAIGAARENVVDTGHEVGNLAA